MENKSFQMELNMLRGKAYTNIHCVFFYEIPSDGIKDKLLHLGIYAYYGNDDNSYGDNIGINSDGELALFKGCEVVGNLISFSTDVLCDIAEQISDGSYKIISR